MVSTIPYAVHDFGAADGARLQEWCLPLPTPLTSSLRRGRRSESDTGNRFVSSRMRPVCELVKPNDRLVRVSSTPCSAYTSRLSTWSSSRGLEGYLISRGASRLDAFSGYPFRTWLPSRAAGATTGAPEVRPSRSSRTRDRSSQVSYAHMR